MIVFKAFLKVLKKCLAPIIMYTVFLIFFGAFNMQTSETSMNFEASKPDVLIVNNDNDNKITNNLIKYIEQNSNIKEIDNLEEKIDDALFYRDVNYIIYIPKNYGAYFLNKLNPQIEIKSTGDYQASLANMMLEKYLKLANIYNETFDQEEDIINSINNTLKSDAKIELATKLDTSSLNKVAFYYNFLNYSLLAGAIYVICLILSSFKKDEIRMRTIISSMDIKRYNRNLLIANSIFGFILWIFYVLISFILLGKIMFTPHGLIYILNSFIFMLCTLTIAFLIGNILSNKNAINGIINVVALGSSFLCGAFVPMEWLPDSVLKIAHILPSYWYILTNENLKNIEVINLTTLKPILFNMGILLIFIIAFIVITNIVSYQKRKID